MKKYNTEYINYLSKKIFFNINKNEINKFLKAKNDFLNLNTKNIIKTESLAKNIDFWYFKYSI